MKKYTLLILVVLLGCIFGTALATDDFTIPKIENASGNTEIFTSIVVSDTALLLSNSKNLYALDTTAQQVTPIAMHNASPEYEQIPQTALNFHGISKDQAIPDWLMKEASLIDKLFWDGELLYGINELNAALYRVDIAEGKATLHALSTLDFLDMESMPFIGSGAACNGSLYLLMGLAAEEVQPSPYRFDIATGAREPLKGQGRIVEITRYQDNHLLLLEETSNSLEITSDSQWQITDLDTETEAYSPLFESSKLNIIDKSVSGLVYDPWRNRVLLQAGKEMLHFISETSYEVVAYMASTWPDCRDIAEDGRLLLASESIYALSTLEEKMLKPLQIMLCSYLDDSMEVGFAEAYPDIVVNRKQGYGHEALSLFSEQITLQSDDIDIFELPIGGVTQKAFEKGYYLPLNQSKSIREKVDAYRPFFQQTVMNGSDIAAIPGSVEQYTLAYSEFALAQLGLTAADMPSTFMELMDFLLAWDERVGDVAQQAEITPFGFPTSNEQLKISLFNTLMDQYSVLMEMDASAKPLYEAELADLLDKLSLVCATMPECGEEKPMVNRYEKYGHIQLNDQRSYLFIADGSFDPGQRNFLDGRRYPETASDFVPIALTLPSQDSPLVLFEGTLLIVNPYSSQKEQAIQWLTFYMNHLPGKDVAKFDRDALPLESETYKGMKEYYTSDIERLEPRIKAAEGAAKSELEAKLQIRQDQLRKIEPIKWHVSTQGLEDYEQIFTHCTVLWNDPYIVSLGSSYAQYIEGNISGHEVAHEFLALCEMILRESR